MRAEYPTVPSAPRDQPHPRTTPPWLVALDTVGTFTMATEMAKHHCIVAIHKHYTVDEWKQFAAEQPQAVPYVAVSAGTSANDMSKLYAAISI
jgi:GMP reductase